MLEGLRNPKHALGQYVVHPSPLSPLAVKFKSHSLSDYNPTSGQVSRFELKKVFNHSIFNQKQTNIGACEYNADEI